MTVISPWWSWGILWIFQVTASFILPFLYESHLIPSERWNKFFFLIYTSWCFKQLWTWNIFKQQTHDCFFLCSGITCKNDYIKIITPNICFKLWVLPVKSAFVVLKKKGNQHEDQRGVCWRKVCQFGAKNSGNIAKARGTANTRKRKKETTGVVRTRFFKRISQGKQQWTTET